MECPNIDKGIPESEFNKKRLYDGYSYWEHTDPDGRKTLVQFCKKKGRKSDVFECLNEDEWHNCYAYISSCRQAPE